MIFNDPNTDDLNEDEECDSNIDEIVNKRDLIEYYQLKQAKEVELDRILFRDQLFKKFINQVIKVVRNFDRKTESMSQLEKKNFVENNKLKIFENSFEFELDKENDNTIISIEVDSNNIDRFKIKAVEEQWGLWLKSTLHNDDQTYSKLTDEHKSNIIKKFEQFKNQVIEEYIKIEATHHVSLMNAFNEYDVIKNPVYFTLKANDLIFVKNNPKFNKYLTKEFRNKNLETAIYLYSEAIS
jgi:hypothetical protein